MTALTYTGASHKRQYNADGVLEYAPHNFAWNSNTLTSWTNQNTSDSGSTVTASIVTNGNGRIYANMATPGVEAGVPMRLAARITYGNHDYVYMSCVTAADKFAGVIWNLNSGATPTVRDEYTGTTGCTIESTKVTADGGGYLLEILFTLDTTDTTPQVNVGFSSATDTINSNGVIHLWDSAAGTEYFELENVRINHANCPSTYIATTGSAVYAARAGTRNRKPVTNKVIYPEQFDNAEWTNSNTTESSGQDDPFGGTDAFTLTETDTGAGSIHYIESTTGIDVEAKEYTHSCYLKAGTRTWAKLEFGTAAGTCYFDLTNGVVGTAANLVDYGISAEVGTGWYRCWITDTLAAGTDKVKITLANADNDDTYDGDGTSGLDIFGANLTEGGIADYIGATNLVDNDKDFTTGWTDTNTDQPTTNNLAPDGTSTADELASTTATDVVHSTYQGLTGLTASQSTTVGCFVKPGINATLVQLAYDTDGSGANGFFCNFNVSTGAKGSVTAMTAGTATSEAITYWGNGWYLCSITGAITTGTVGRFTISIIDDIAAIKFDTSNLADNDSLILWGAQVSEGNLAPYVGAPQTAYLRAGYTAEAAATNLAEDSEDLSQWTILGTDSFTVTTGDTDGLGPDGLSSLNKLVLSSDTSEVHRLYYSYSGMTSGTDECFSFVVRAGTQRYVNLNFYCNFINEWFGAVWDMLTGEVTTTGEGTSGGTIQGVGSIPLGNGLFQLWISGDPERTFSVSYVQIQSCETGTPTPGSYGHGLAYTGGDEDFYVGCFMHESGATYPSSYIFTDGASDSRSADDLMGASLGGTIGGTEGTLIVESHPFNNITTLANLSDGTASDRVLFRTTSSNQISTFVISSLGANNTFTSGVLILDRILRMALRWNATTSNVAVQGTLDTEASTANPDSMTDLDIGQSFAATEQGAHIRSIEYYSTDRTDGEITTDSTITDDGTTYRDEL